MNIQRSSQENGPIRSFLRSLSRPTVSVRTDFESAKSTRMQIELHDFVLNLFRNPMGGGGRLAAARSESKTLIRC